MMDQPPQNSGRHPQIVKPQRRPHRALITGFPVVLDACILCNATIRDFVLWAAYLALYRPVWSKDIVDEVSRTLEQTFGIHPDRVAYVIKQMQDSFPEAQVEGYESLLPAMTNHPKDRHVLAAGIIGRAQLIVTENIKHFPEESLAPFHMETTNADDFLRDLLDIDRERMLEVFRTLTQTRKQPPKTSDEILEALESNGCPGFAQDLRDTLKSEYGDS
jgi:hypothetical protein